MSKTKKAALLMAPIPHEPRPCPELQGELGLTSLQIAKSLGASHDDVKRNIRRIAERHPIFRMESGEMRNDKRKGRPVQFYIVPVDVAKFIVARYENDTGAAYLQYLIDFENKARKAEPEMRSALAEMQKVIEELRAQLAAVTRPRALPKPSSLPVTLNVTKYESLLGEGEIYHRTRARVPVAGLTALEVLKAKRAHMILSIEGISRRLEKTDLEIEFLEQSPAHRMHLVKSD